MTLSVKCLKIDTYGENIAYLSCACKIYKPEEFLGLNKVEVSGRHGKTILATLNVVEDENILGCMELGLSIPAFRRLGLKEGGQVSITPATPPASLDHVRAKIYGEVLGARAIREIVDDIAAYRYSKMEIAAFLVSCASFMTVEEIFNLTVAMAKAGNILDWDHAYPLVVDKHCVGGLPGNRTSMVIVPIVAAYGLTIPKTSSRAITSPSGTADTMEVLAEVDLDLKKMKQVVHKHHGCLVWGGKVNLSPADDIMISVERPLGIDTPEQMVASIMSKKIAAGSSHLVIDIPVGPTAKVKTRKEAMRLRKLFEHIARRINMVVDVVLTDGTEPVGFGIGPVLEARDVMDVLACREAGPKDLRERSLMLAGRILEFDAKLPGGEGYRTAKRILESGQALETMSGIIRDQGKAEKTHPGTKVFEVKAPKSGQVKTLDCGRLARIARAAGAPHFKGAGVDLLKKTGEKVKQGEPLYRIHAEIRSDFAFARAMAEENSGYKIR